MQPITKAQAKEWLSNTTIQRRTRPKAIERLRSDMNAGRWEADVAPPILINKTNGAVVDGQHRLKAYLTADESFVLYADVRFVDGEHIVVVDTGTPRNLADTLAALGYENAKYLSAFYGTAYYWATGTGGTSHISRIRQVEWIARNPNAELAAKHASESRGGVMHVPSGTTSCLFDIGEYAEGGDMALEFIETLRKGHLGYDPARRLVEAYLDARNPKTKKQIHSRQLSLLVARVYVGWINDESLGKLFARRRSLEDLPGWNDWIQANWE